jgi:hypothetical protein
MTLDKETRMAIQAAIKKAVMEANEIYNEEYLTPKQLCDQVPLFTKEWLRHNWRMLPSERVGWKDSDGVDHECTRCYPKKKILRMISDGAFRDLHVADVAIK